MLTSLSAVAEDTVTSRGADTAEQKQGSSPVLHKRTLTSLLPGLNSNCSCCRVGVSTPLLMHLRDGAMTSKVRIPSMINTLGSSLRVLLQFSIPEVVE
jgi:hypothetical protein